MAIKPEDFNKQPPHQRVIGIMTRQIRGDDRFFNTLNCQIDDLKKHIDDGFEEGVPKQVLWFWAGVLHARQSIKQGE